MTTGAEYKPTKETYVQLARLAHDSFEQRRSYEWKVHFGLWAAIAAVVYSAIKEKIILFSNPLEAYAGGLILWAIYFLHFILKK